MYPNTVPTNDSVRSGLLDSASVRALENQTPRLAPWEAEPYRLWSLLDMRPVETAELAKAVTDLATIRGLSGSVEVTEAVKKYLFNAITTQAKAQGVAVSIEVSDEDYHANEAQVLVKLVLEAVESRLGTVGLSKRFYDKAIRLKSAIARKPFQPAVA